MLFTHDTMTLEVFARPRAEDAQSAYLPSYLHFFEIFTPWDQPLNFELSPPSAMISSHAFYRSQCCQANVGSLEKQRQPVCLACRHSLPVESLECAFFTYPDEAMRKDADTSGAVNVFLEWISSFTDPLRAAMEASSLHAAIEALTYERELLVKLSEELEKTLG